MNPQEVIAAHREMTEGFHEAEPLQAAASGLFLCGLLLGAVLLVLALLSVADEPSFADMVVR